MPSTQMTLSKKTKIEIALLNEGSPSCELAGSELRKYLKLCLGIEAPILGRSEGADVACSVGTVPAQQKHGFLPDALLYMKLGEQGLYIRVGEGRVILSGETGVGVLYAVYTFIERFLGVRFLGLEDEEWVPQTDELVLHNVEIMQRPAFSLRGLEPRPKDVDDLVKLIDWMAKNRLNYLRAILVNFMPIFAEAIEEIRKRGIHLDPGGHCLDDFLYNTWMVDRTKGYEELDCIIDEKFHKHPEWHCLKDGKRIVCKGSWAHFCFSCQDAVEEFCRNAIAFLKAYPFLNSLFILLSDSKAVFCECEQCRKRPLTQNVQTFYNNVADRVHRVFPGLPIKFVAYADFIVPTENVPLSRDVSVDISFWGQDYRHGLGDDIEKHWRYMAILRRWLALSKISKGDNRIGLNQYYSYSSCPRVTGQFKTAEVARGLGVTCMYDGVMAGALSNGFPAVLTAYFMARALWDPRMSPENILTALFDPIFGQGSGHLKGCLGIADQLDVACTIEPVWWRWRQYPLDLLHDSISCCNSALADMGRTKQLLLEAQAKCKTDFALKLIEMWAAWRSATTAQIKGVKAQLQALEMLIQAVEQGNDLEESPFVQAVVARLRCVPRLREHQNEISSISAAELTKLTEVFGLPSEITPYVSFLGKGKERVLANVAYNAIYNWQGCKFARKEEGCDKCAIIACPDFIEGPGVRRYPVREKPMPVDFGQGVNARWVMPARK